MSRARSEAGFTVVEVLLSAVILSLVATGAMKFVEVLLRQSRGVVERTDAMQRGRMAMDELTRSLRSQVCLNEDTEGLIAGKPDEVQFYADYGNGVNPPQRRTLRFADGSLTETTIQGTGSMTNPAWTSPAQNRTLLKGVSQDVDTKGTQTPTDDRQIPVLQYFAFDDDRPGVIDDTPLSTPLTATDLGRAAVVRITFMAGGFRDSKFATHLQDDVLLRNTDPNAARPDPTCR